MYRILSLDGGGIRGIFTARIIERLYKKNPEFLSNIDLIAGCSTGAILGMALASGKTPREIRLKYEIDGPKIFKNRDWIDAISFDEVTRANYSHEALKEIGESFFQGKALQDLNIRCLVPTVRLSAAKDNLPRHLRPKYFDSSKDKKDLAIDVALRATAAPTYFPTYQGYCDGSLFAVNPSDSAKALAESEGQKDIRVLSIGTGFYPFKIEDKIDKSGKVKPLDWGLSQWATKFITTTINSSLIASHYKTKTSLKEKYHRIDAIIEDVDLDAIEAIDELIEVANNIDLTEAKKWIDDFWNIDKES